MAVENGFAASEIVFAGVGKTDREIEYALGQEIFSRSTANRCTNCKSSTKSPDEWAKRARIALRINPDVDPKTHRYITTGKADNKFGISYDEIDAAIASLEKTRKHRNRRAALPHRLADPRYAGVRNVQQTGNSTSRSGSAKRASFLKHLNMGGGLGIDYDDPDREPMPDFETYFDIFTPQPENRRRPDTVHFELGPLAGRAVRRIDYARALQQRNVGRYEDRDRRRRNDRHLIPAGPVRRETQDRTT